MENKETCKVYVDRDGHFKCSGCRSKLADERVIIMLNMFFGDKGPVVYELLAKMRKYLTQKEYNESNE